MNEVRKEFRELSKKLSYERVKKIIDRALAENREFILKMQQDQLAAGIDSKERLLRPTYLQDPMFKSPKSAKGYSEFKKNKASKPRIWYSQYQPALGDTPNLYITGVYYSGLLVKESKVLGDTVNIQIGNAASFASEVSMKYGRELLGLTDKHLDLLFKYVINLDLEQELGLS